MLGSLCPLCLSFPSWSAVSSRAQCGNRSLAQRWQACAVPSPRSREGDLGCSPAYEQHLALTSAPSLSPGALSQGQGPLRSTRSWGVPCWGNGGSERQRQTLELISRRSSLSTGAGGSQNYPDGRRLGLQKANRDPSVGGWGEPSE